MALPAQVQKQLDDLTAYEQSMTAPPEEAVPQTPPEPPVEPVVAEQSEPEQTPPEPQDHPAEVDETKWEHKYRRLQGKYDAEVPRLTQEVRELREMIAQLQAAPKEAPPAPPPEPEPEVEDVTAEETAEYGADMIAVMKKIAAANAKKLEKAMKAQLDALKSENEALKTNVQGVQGATFETRLLQAVPDFMQLDTSESWAKWLNEYDPMLRAPRRTVAEAAYRNGDVAGVKHYVDMYKASLAPSAPAAKPDRSEELRKQIQPTKTNASVSPATTQKLIHKSDVDRMHAKAQELLRKGKFDEAETLIAEVGAAVAEGRVSA